METQAYLYKWTHIPSNKWYVGSRTAKGCHPDDGYICSSKYVKPKILSLPQEWKREILCIGTSEDMRILEIKYLTSLSASQDPTSFNKTNGGLPGKIKAWNKGLTGFTHSEETKRKLSLLHTGKHYPKSEETKRKLSEACKGRPSPTKGKIKGPLSLETKQKISEKMKQIRRSA